MVDIATINSLPIEQGDLAEWPENIPRLEDGWWPTGGAVDPENDSGLMNWQALELGRRTEWLKAQLGGLGGTANSSADIDALDATGMIEITSAATGNPAPGYAGALFHTEGTGGKARQFCVSDNGRVYSRLRTDATPTWTDWLRIDPQPIPTAGGTAAAYTLPASVGALEEGMEIAFMAPVTNAGAATLQVGAGPVYDCIPMRPGAALPAGYIRTDAPTRGRVVGGVLRLDREPETGENATGTYTRYADGRLEAHRSTSVIYTNNPGFMSRTFGLPAPFTDVPHATITLQNATPAGYSMPNKGSIGFVGIAPAESDGSDIKVYVYASSTTGQGLNIEVEAFGNWYE